MGIDGKTRVVLHLAYPSDHLRTPAFFNHWCEQHKQNAILVPWQIHPSQLSVAWEGLRQAESLAGVIVTIPHKIAVADLCDELADEAQLLGTVNVARRTLDGRFIGRMFDGEGFLRGLENEGYSVSGKRVLLLGAGGAATGIAHAMAAAGVDRLTIANRSRPKAEQLAKRLQSAFPQVNIQAGQANGNGYDTVINATPLGMKPNDPLPIDPTSLRDVSLVAEAIMQPDITPLLHQARQQGLHTHKGVHMITGQVECLAEFLLGATDSA